MPHHGHGVLGTASLAPVHRCASSVCCVACAVSWASWVLFTGVPARCVVLRVRCPGPPGSCSPVCPLGVLCCVCGVLCLLAPVHRCARSVCCFACAVSWASWLLFTGVPALCVVLRVRCPGPPGSCSPATDHRPRTTGKQWYDNQLCYGPMYPTYHIHRYTCVDEKTKYVAKEGAHGTTPHAKKNDEPPRTSKGMPTNTNHNHISPIFFPPKAPTTARYTTKKKKTTKAQKVMGRPRRMGRQ